MFLPHAAHAAHKPANATQDAADKRSLPLWQTFGLVQPFGLFRPAPPDIDRRRDFAALRFQRQPCDVPELMSTPDFGRAAT